VKRFLVLAVCILSAGAVQGDTIPGFTLAGHLTFDVVRNSTANANYDRLDFTLTGLTGPATGYAINIIEGEWAATGGTISLASDAAVAAMNTDLDRNWSWQQFTANGLGPSGYSILSPYGQPSPTSFTNFSSFISGYSRWGRVGSGADFTSFNGSWFTTGGLDPDGIPLIARLWVKKGWTNVTFLGQMGFTYGSGTVENVSLTLVPEPSTLALAGTGVAGLGLAMWRKRKGRS
jgi:hypothetical protein